MSLNSLQLFAPGEVGQFDYVTSTVGLPFDFRELQGYFMKPKMEHQKIAYLAYHEYAHHFQFSTTTYGLLNRAMVFSQIGIINDILVSFSEGRVPFALPLIKTGRLQGPDSGNHLNMLLYLTAVLEDLRLATYGHKCFPSVHEASINPYRLIREIQYKTKSIPRLGFYSSPQEPTRVPLLKIDTLLESHAHVLSTLWLIKSARLARWPKRRVSEIIENYGRLAIGRYAPFVELGFSKNPVGALRTYADLCDIALNPTLYSFGSRAKAKHVLIEDTRWNPTQRLWLLFSKLGEKGSPKSWKDPKIRLTDLEWVAELLSHLEMEPDFFEFSPKNPSMQDNRLQEVLHEMIGSARNSHIKNASTKGISLAWLETLGIMSKAVDVRRKTATLRDLDSLLDIAAGPNIIQHVSHSTPAVFHIAVGLRHLGLADSSSLYRTSEEVSFESVADLYAMSQLMRCNRQEIEKNRGAGQTPMDAMEQLLSSYGLDLDSFAG